jgi:hypothetical protein
MKTIWLTTVLMASSLCCGCRVCSLNPLASSGEGEIVPELLGTWIADGKSHCSFSVLREEDGYRITFDEPRPNVVYHGKLVRLGEGLFMDLSSEMRADIDSLPIHHILRVECGDGRLRIATVDPGKVQEVVRGEPACQVAATDEGRRTVLTGSTADLQEFFRDHASEIFGAPLAFHQGSRKSQIRESP